MSDFKNFNGSRQSGNGSNNSEKANGGNAGNGAGNGANAQQTANLAAEIAKAFNGKSEKDIWLTILAQAEQGKRDGTLTNADLDNFYNTVAPLVDGYKRQKLKSVIAKLKEI